MTERESVPFDSQLAYLIAGLLVFTGLLFTLNHPTGIAVLASGIFLLPNIRRYLEAQTGYRLSSGATLGIVLLLISVPVLASYSVDGGSSIAPEEEGSSISPEQEDKLQTDETATEPDLLNRPPENHLPTIEDFESGWRQIDDEDTPDNTTQFFNTQTETFIEFQITYYDSVGEAQKAQGNHQAEITEKGIATSSVETGSEGFIYSRGSDLYFVRFRVLNVVGRLIIRLEPPYLLLKPTQKISHDYLRTSYANKFIEYQYRLYQ